MDTNEIAGWISNCKNAEYLRQIRYGIDQRLRELLGEEGAAKITAPRSAPAKAPDAGRPPRGDKRG